MAKTAAATTTPPLRSGFEFDVTKILHVDQDVDAAKKNVRGGPAELHSIAADHTYTSGSTLAYLKLYDIIDDSLVTGVSLPILGFPVPVAGTNPAGGLANIAIIGGFRFLNGISMLAAAEGGTLNTTDVGEDSLDARLISKDI